MDQYAQLSLEFAYGTPVITFSLQERKAFLSLMGPLHSDGPSSSYHLQIPAVGEWITICPPTSQHCLKSCFCSVCEKIRAREIVQWLRVAKMPSWGPEFKFPASTSGGLQLSITPAPGNLISMGICIHVHSPIPIHTHN